MIAPKDSQVIINESHYKIGRLGLPFIWIDNDWLVSTIPVSEVIRAIKGKIKTSKHTVDKSLDGGIRDTEGNLATREEMLAAADAMGITLKQMRARIHGGMLIRVAFTTPYMRRKKPTAVKMSELPKMAI